MKKYKAYITLKEYLDDTENFLEVKELENNIILGNCYKLGENSIVKPEYHFSNCFNNDLIKISSMIFNSRTILSCNLISRSYTEYIADNLLKNSLFINGVMGLTGSAEIFSERICKGKIFTRNLILYKLTKVNELKYPEGNFLKAEIKDSGIISNMIYDFVNETNTLRGKSKEDISAETNILIQSNSIFKWVCKDKIVCISTFMRKTKNFGIIGLVFTPPEYRGKGFASGCVQKHSEYILRSGFRGSGLYTDKLNTVSNKIYKKIGYRKISEFTDMKFL
ncbi:MAG TPA: GNAT family N-acetyltransferase [Ignavibacteria bacterium]|nr:GNAT family N-acetyltransferase [Ignavibacteria bacterium]